MLLNHGLIILIDLLLLLNSCVIFLHLWILVVSLSLVNELIQYSLIDCGTPFSLNEHMRLTEDFFSVIDFWVFLIKLLFVEARGQDKSICSAWFWGWLVGLWRFWHDTYHLLATETRSSIFVWKCSCSSKKTSTFIALKFPVIHSMLGIEWSRINSVLTLSMIWVFAASTKCLLCWDDVYFFRHIYNWSWFTFKGRVQRKNLPLEILVSLLEMILDELRLMIKNIYLRKTSIISFS